MGSVLLLLLLLLVAAHPGGGRVQGPQDEQVPGLKGSPPAPVGTSANFQVHISPELVAVPPGDSVWLNCSHNCPLPGRSSLHTQLRQGQKVSRPGWVSYQLLDVRAWSSIVRCLVPCAGETREATARINAYSEGQGLRPSWGEGRRVEEAVALGGARGP
jgi:hypothetical protein